ncbi:MAG: hypothetical protein ACM3PW_06290 [Chlamydiota bacterium]
MNRKTSRAKIAWWGAFLFITVVSTVTGQRKDIPSVVLEARETSAGCCQPSYDRTYIRVFSDNSAEWDEFDDTTKSYVPRKAVLSKKELSVVKWVVENMKGMTESYTAESAKGNIDSSYSFEITGRDKGRAFHTEIFFGLPVDAENYSHLSVRVRNVACNISVMRSRLAHEKADLQFCKKYYVGW